MTKNTMFLKLIQTILTDDDIKEIAQDLGVEDASNKVTLRTVTEYMMVGRPWLDELSGCRRCRSGSRSYSAGSLFSV